MNRLISYLIILLAIRLYSLKRPIRDFLKLPTLPASYSPLKECNIAKSTVEGKSPSYCEDEVLWEVNGRHRLILSCDPGRKAWNTVMGPLKYADPRGTLWSYTPAVGRLPGVFKPLTLHGYPVDAYFHPLGIDIFTDPGSSRSILAVINHGKDHTTIELFSLENDSASLTYIRTFASPSFRAPNGIRFTSPTSFYITQDHFFTRRLPWPFAPLLPLLETFLAIPTGVVSHITFTPNTDSFETVRSAIGIPFANGIAISPDGEEVAVSSSTANSVYLYARDIITQKLRLKDTIEVPFAADNLDYSSSGSLVVTGHPHFPSLASVAWNGTKITRSPSWVVEISKIKDGENISTKEEAPYSVYQRISTSEKYATRTLYQSDGSHFQTSTTGALDESSNTLYVTGLYEDGLLICQG